MDLFRQKFLSNERVGAAGKERERCFKFNFSAIFYSNFFDLCQSFSNGEKTSEEEEELAVARRKFCSPAAGRRGRKLEISFSPQ